jgi:hypothetical protein
LCDCGSVVLVETALLTRGRKRSCGCLAKDLVRQRNYRHGLRKTPEYNIWRGMKGRCLNSAGKYYSYYGGRGIGIDPSWMDFVQFYRDMGPRPGPDYSIDRIDNDKGYGPDNCRWATPLEQTNNRRVTRRISYGGQMLTIKEVASLSGISASTIAGRLERGWPEGCLTVLPSQLPLHRRQLSAQV